VAALAAETGARTIECQTNLPRQAELFHRLAADAEVEHLLFADGPPTELELADAKLVARSAWTEPGGSVDGPEGTWLVVRKGVVIAAGGVLTHYNPPFGDLYMEVVPEARGEGVGSFLVQELRVVARRSGLVPAARCDPDNEASRRSLLRGGMVPCGRLLSGRIAVG
jgi:GNAT superfamily N-acetyltransferase